TTRGRAGVSARARGGVGGVQRSPGERRREPWRSAGILTGAAALLVALGWGAGSVAQTPPAAAPAAGTETPVLQEVIVTGSRIAPPNATHPSPVKAISHPVLHQTGHTEHRRFIHP